MNVNRLSFFGVKRTPGVSGFLVPRGTIKIDIFSKKYCLISISIIANTSNLYNYSPSILLRKNPSNNHLIS